MLAFLTPLPPVKSGIANYASMLLPELARRFELVAVVDQQEVGSFPWPVISYSAFRQRRGDFDHVVYQLGNNEHHEWIYGEAMARPGIVVLHEIVLHHLLVERTLARGLVGEYLDEMQRNHGPAGRAWGEARARGYHTELSNFLYPASRLVAEHALGIIVHNRYAASSLRQMGVDKPISVVEHPLDLSTVVAMDRTAIRRALGFDAADRVVGMFGFVTEAKRPETVFASFAEAMRTEPALRLLVVGEAAPNIDLAAIAERHQLPEGSWRSTGYVPDGEFDGYIAAVDLVLNLRYPTAGETSGALLRTFAAGRPVAVNDYAQFSEYPDDVVTRIAFGSDEIAEIVRFLRDAEPTVELAMRQRLFLREHSSVARAAEGYADAIRGGGISVLEKRGLRLIPLFPEVDLVSWTLGAASPLEIRFRLRNCGVDPIGAACYGEPGYRVIAKVIRDGVVHDRWVPLPSDLRPGEIAEMSLVVSGVSLPVRVELLHGIEGIPQPATSPFATFEVTP